MVIYPVLTEDRSSYLAEEVLLADTIGTRSRRRKRLKLPIILDSPIPNVLVAMMGEGLGNCGRL